MFLLSRSTSTPKPFHLDRIVLCSRQADMRSSSLVCNSENRLGRTGAHEIKQHPFFAGVDFDNLRRFRAPFEPRLASEVDTTYFPTEELEAQAANAMDIDDPTLQAAPEQHETPEMTLPFIGYTFKRFENNFR